MSDDSLSLAGLLPGWEKIFPPLPVLSRDIPGVGSAEGPSGTCLSASSSASRFHLK